MFTGAALIWRLDCGWRFCFQDGSLTCSWLLAQDLSCSSCGPFHMLKYPHDMVAGFPQRERSKRVKWKPQCLFWCSLRRHTEACPVVSCCLDRSPYSIREGWHKGVNTRRWESQGHLAGWLPQTPLKSLYSLIINWYLLSWTLPFLLVLHFSPSLNFEPEQISMEC